MIIHKKCRGISRNERVIEREHPHTLGKTDNMSNMRTSVHECLTKVITICIKLVYIATVVLLVQSTVFTSFKKYVGYSITLCHIQKKIVDAPSCVLFFLCKCPPVPYILVKLLIPTHYFFSSSALQPRKWRSNRHETHEKLKVTWYSY